MQVRVIGLNHNTSPLEVREKLHFSKSSLPAALQRLQRAAKVKEAVILSTCNRVEIYFIPALPEEDSDKIEDFLSCFHHIDKDIFRDSLYEYSNLEAVAHLFRVVSGINSLVIGENQILSQVKEAYRKAFQTGYTGKILNRLFQTSFEVAKIVRTKTGINRGAISVGSVAVELAEKTLGKLSSRKVMVLGAGEISGLVMKHLISRRIESIIVSNRSFKRAKILAREYAGEAIRFEKYLENIPQVDILISSTSAPHLLVKKKDIVSAMKKRGEKDLFLIDLAIPRDIDPEVRKVRGVFLYNIDHLKQIVDSNFHERKQKLPHVERIIQENVEEFKRWVKAREAVSTIKRLNKKVEAIREKELKKTLPKLDALKSEDKEKIEYLTKRIISNIFDGPRRKLKEKLSHGNEHHYIRAVEDIFELH